MSYSNGIITKPVSIHDVQQAIGSGSTDLGTLCKHANINKFARYKPLSYASVMPITDAIRASILHGITIPDVVQSTTKNGASIADAAGNDWAYTKPSGGANSPYRLTDFANIDNLSGYGYDHYAVPPIQCVYPRDGWTFLRGSSSSMNLIINFDLDPADSITNLQATDFEAAGLDLNEWKFCVYVENIGTFDADDFILDNGEIAGDTVVVTIPAGTGSYNRNVYVCMWKYADGKYNYIPLPKQGDFNPSTMYLHILDDAEQSGGGIPGNDTEEMFKNVEFSYDINGTFKTAWDCTDNGTAAWSMRSSGGTLVVKMKLRNTSGSSSTIQRGDFTLDLDGQTFGRVPTTMYNSSKAVISSVTIANNSEVVIYLEFDAIFTDLGGDWDYSNENSSWSMDFARAGATLFGGDIYAYKAPYNDGWTQR